MIKPALTLSCLLATFTACGGEHHEVDPERSGGDTPKSSVVRGGKGDRLRRNFIGIYRTWSKTFILENIRPGWEHQPAESQVTLVTYEPTGAPVVGDWDGDGTETHGVFQGGSWSLTNTPGKTTADLVFGFGDGPGDTPVTGDWDGNGTTTPGLFRFGKVFVLRNSNSTGNHDHAFTLSFAAAGDLPIAGDWDGDGIDTVGLYRPSTSTFLLVNRNVDRSGPDHTIQLGTANSGDQPIVGDWDDDGVTTVGIRRRHMFLLRNDNDPGDGRAHLFKGLGDDTRDIPLAGNWNPSAPSGHPGAPLPDTFIIGVDYQPPCRFATWKSRGINTVVRVPGPEIMNLEPVEAVINGETVRCKSTASDPVVNWRESGQLWTDRADREELFMIRHRIGPEDDSEAGLIAYALRDEPENTAGGVPHTELDQEAAVLRSANPRRPIFENLNGAVVVSQVDFPGVNPDRCNGSGDYGQAPLDCYKRLLANLDWVSSALYPFGNTNLLAEQGVKNIKTVQNKLRRWAPGKPQFAHVQLGTIHGNRITPTQVRLSIWTAIINGARGIIYFPLKCDPCTAADDTDEGVRTELITQNQRITNHAARLLAPINPSSIGFRAKLPLQLTWRHVGGKAYVYVLNPTGQGVTADMRIEGITPTTRIDVNDGARKVGAAGNPTFTDTVDAHTLNIYRVE